MSIIKNNNIDKLHRILLQNNKNIRLTTKNNFTDENDIDKKFNKNISANINQKTHDENLQKYVLKNKQNKQNKIIQKNINNTSTTGQEDNTNTKLTIIKNIIDGININKMNINNIFEYCDYRLDVSDTLYYISGKMEHNTLIKLGVVDNKFVTYTNEWLYLIRAYYPNNSVYNRLVDLYYDMIKLDTDININEDVIDFVTSFSTGTTHGYTGLFNLLNNYLRYHGNKKIIVYRNSQQGILDIIRHIIPEQNIIYVDANKLYKIRRLILVENRYHDYTIKFINEIKYIFMKYLMKSNSRFAYNEFDNKKICIIKSNISDNKTADGIADYKLVEQYCNKNNMMIVEPTKYNEVDFINIVNRCVELTVSWGTAFFKNYPYVSFKCRLINVLIFDNNYIQQYNNLLNANCIINKYINADIKYNVIDDINKYLKE
jgi:hypothetical protein